MSASHHSGSAIGPFSGHMAIIASNAIYTVGLICQKALAGDTSILLIAFWQFFGASILLWITTLIMDGVSGLSLKDGLLALAWGALAPGLVLTTNMIGSRWTDGVSMSLIWGLLPFVAPLMGPFVLGEELRRDVLIGAAIAFIGVSLGAAFRHAEGWTTWQGLSMCGLAVIFAGTGFVLGRVINRNRSHWRRSAAFQMTGAAAFAFIILLFGDFGPPPLETPRQIWFLAYLIVFMSFINFLLLNFAFSVVPVAFVSLYTALMPAFGAVASWVLLGDKLRLIDYAVIALVVFGVAIPSLFQMARTRNGGKAQTGAGV